jgi:3',5'-cyclic AMP phosphodiesterase CpdA
MLLTASWSLSGPAQPNPPTAWNPANLAKINPAHNPLIFAVLADSRDSRGIFGQVLQQMAADPELTFAIHLGDIASQGKPREFYQFFDQIRQFLRIPLVAAPGNHDLDRSSGPSRKTYESLFGPPYYSFAIGRTCFLVLDNADAHGLSGEQFAWLEAELTKAQAFQHRLVFMHVPLFDPRHKGKPHAMAEAQGRRLAELFQRQGVHHIFAGHIHGYFAGEWQGIPFTITGGAGAPLQGADPEHYFYHYLKVRVDGDKLDVRVQRVEVPVESPSLTP